MPAGNAYDPADTVARALSFAARGWRPFPVEYAGKRPAVGIAWGTATASPQSEKTLAYWFGRAPVNIGIAAKGSGLVIIDEDRAGAFAELAADHGFEVPQTYRVKTAKGWHYYFAADERYPIGNRPGVLKDYGIDVRGGGAGDGGYVVSAGSLHESGYVYTASDEEAEPVAMPWALTQLLLPREEAPVSVTPDKARSGGSGILGGDERRFTMEQATEYVKAFAQEPLRDAREGTRNTTLNNSAVLMGHFIPHFWTVQVVTQALMRISASIGLAGEEMRDTIASGLKQGMREPYIQVVAPEAAEPGTDDWKTAVEAEVRRLRLRDDALRAYQEELGRQPFVQSELHRLEVRDEAQRTMELRERPDLRSLRGAQFLADGAKLTYLIPGLIYRGSTAKVYGPPGAGKTHLALDMALSVATGVPWMGQKTLERRIVHFLMAEGEAVNRLRVAAFVAKHGVDPEDLENFVAIPEGVLLTPEGVKLYLELVAQDEPGLVFLDTKNAMMAGDENSASDVGVMIRAMRLIRDAGKDTAVVLIDHTGLADESRGRGSNAVTAAMDTEIRVSKARKAGVAVIYTAEVTRDKASAQDDAARFGFTLWGQDSVDRPEGVAPPPVVVWDDKILQGDPIIAQIDQRWWEVPDEALPDALVELKGNGDDAARSIFRMLMVTSDPDGLTRADVFGSITKDARDQRLKLRVSVSTLKRGWARLKPGQELEEGYIVPGATPSKWVLNPEVHKGSNPRSGVGSEDEE